MIVDLEKPPAITRSTDHDYYLTLPDGAKFGPCPGATKVLKVLDHPAFVQWAANQTADAAMALHANGWDALEAIVGPKGVHQALTARKNWKRDEAAHLGTVVHDLAEKYVRTGIMPPLTEATEKRAKAYAEWWVKSGWTKPMTEFVMFNATSEYGGTGDLLARDRDGALVLADLKTGSKGIFRESILQLTAYTDAEWISTMGAPTVMPMPKVDRHVLLWVTEDGVKEVPVTIGDNERVAWYAAMALYRWTQAQKERLT